MKKLTLLFGALCACVLAFGQVKVQSNGKVVINPSGTATVTGTQLTVNTTDSRGVSVNTTPSSSNAELIGLLSSCSGAVNSIKLNPYSAGVIGRSSLTTGSSSTTVAFGVIGNGWGSTQGRNIGVFGYLADGMQDIGAPPIHGAGIFGATNFYQSAQSFNQAYAGFFAGDVNITGLLTVAGVPVTSDARYKQNIADLKQEETNKLFELRPVEYNLIQRYTEYTDSTGNPAKLGVFDEESQLFKNKHYGLIAQEVQKIYPDLV